MHRTREEFAAMRYSFGELVATYHSFANTVELRLLVHENFVGLLHKYLLLAALFRGFVSDCFRCSF